VRPADSGTWRQRHHDQAGEGQQTAGQPQRRELSHAADQGRSGEEA